MKTNSKYYMNLVAGLYITSVSLFAGARAQAQHRDLFFAFESTSSTRKYTLHSDLDNLKGRTLVQQGRTYGIIFGSSLATAKITLGNFSSENKDRKSINSNTTELGVNISLLQLISKQDRVIEPYFVTSFESTKIKSAGMYTPLKAPVSAGSSTCSCQCPDTGGPPTHASPAADTGTPKPAPYSGNFGTARINLGVGLNVHLSRGHFFLNLFGEMKYGVAAGTTASTQALLNTYALSQVVYNTGVSIGISNNRSHGRLRKHRFR